ncbi:MAG TPA: SMP-30/gluconolactonase/LRE family protein [Solirubrobacteraceae bacterium]|nr:SMP-30/gluconolactonase/LRE family protein [Solirubrobacteraceae bacterium]
MDLLTSDVRHAESPRWTEDRLWFSDQYGHAVRTLGLDGRLETVASIPNRPSGLGRLPDGRWLLITADDGKLNWLEPGRVTETVDLAPLIVGRAGDMVVDGRGWAYISDTGFDYDDPERRLGQVLLFTEEGGVRVVATGTNYANGSAVSADGSRFFLAESFGERITVFDIDDDGSLSNRRVFAELGTVPDGLCLDAAGGVWVALAFKRELAHVNVDGVVDDRLPVRGAMAIACALGGPDRRTLFACSVDSTPSDLSRGILDGGVIESTVVEVPGAGWP